MTQQVLAFRYHGVQRPCATSAGYYCAILARTAGFYQARARPPIQSLPQIRPKASDLYARHRGFCVSIVSIVHARDECPKPCGCFPPRIETSWQIVLTVLTVVCPFSTPALILIVRLPARPSRLKDISMPSTRSKVCGTTQPRSAASSIAKRESSEKGSLHRSEWAKDQSADSCTPQSASCSAFANPPDVPRQVRRKLSDEFTV
jgi:hypothetical protein